MMSPKRPKSTLSSSGHPDGILPVVLTSATQELFGCRADEDVTGDHPYKLLKKDDIIQDIRTRAAVSDFSPVKQIVLNYPETEMLLVFDRDFTYGQNFYLALTPEAKNRILDVSRHQPSQPATPEVLLKELSKTPEATNWISLGSEKEIEEESVRETRERLVFKFSRLRRKFGEPVRFTDRNAADAKDGYLECPSYQDSRFSVKVMQRDCGIQAVPALRSSSAQTQWKNKRNNCTQYVPREFSEEEKNAILQSESLKQFCESALPWFLHALQQEEIHNVFVDDWKALGTGAEDSDYSGKVYEGFMLYQAFAVHKYIHDKEISCINWHPTISGVIAVALREKNEERYESASLVFRPSLILFYSFADPSSPQLLLECPSDILAFEFCPSDPNIIVGGCVNGQVVLWDVSAHVTRLRGAQPSGKKAPVNTDTFDLSNHKENKSPVVPYSAVSALESSHKGPITDVHWLPQTFEVSRTGLPLENKYNVCVQLVTCSPDCSLMFWDVRLPKLLNQSVLDRKQNVDHKPQMSPYNVPDTFKHLDRTWKPLFRVSLPKINTGGDYIPLKFSIENDTSDGNTEEARGLGENLALTPPDYSQLRVPSAKTLKALEDINTKIYIGTQNGEIVYTDWKLEKDESGRLHSPKPLHCFSIHQSSVNTVQRSPFFKDIILTGTSPFRNCTFAVWKEGVMDGPIIFSPSSEQLSTVACWSQSRPAVFFVGKEDGSIEVWNLLEKTNEPAHVYTHVANGKITCIQHCVILPKQHFLAVSDDLGVVRVLEIPRTLSVPSRNETLTVRNYLKQEEERLSDLLRRQKDCSKPNREAQEVKTKTEPSKPTSSQDENKDQEKEKNEYLMLEESILRSIGLLPVSAHTHEI